MKKIIKLIKREFLTKVFTKGFLIGTLLGPIFLLGIMFGPAYFMTLSSEEPMTIYVVDHTGTMLSPLKNTFNDTLKNGQPRFVFSPLKPADYQKNADIYRQDVEESTVDAIIIFPEDLKENNNVTYVGRTVSDIDLIQKFRNGISDIVNNDRLREAGFDPQLVKKLTSKVDIQTRKLVEGEEQERGFDQEYISSMIFLFILYITIIVYGSSVMRSVIEEKTSRIIEVLLSSTNSFQFMMGKLFGVGSVGLVQYLIWASMAVATFFVATSSMPAIAQYINISPDILFYFVLFFVIGFFTFSTLYAAVGAMCSDMQDAQSLSTPVTILVIIPFIISFMVIKNPSTDMAQLLSFLPFFTPLIMFLRISLVTPPFWEILTALIINILVIIGIVWLASRIFRVGILMYGKRPTVPEIVKWIRYS